ncbi:DarT ssDNA thymidine ADP-ribosyltransferase family protein [Paenibacillus polymyxa]|uniref:DarT ssDNA thymidine ADP-ribosyltransferase family protein n=1 Tax=Paenibacillus polymyxa TaxID=1406 RepID=UPI00084625A4|nr:DarT ssDNA thymidine ADP-ribosyltransferase family protein [Paenibacillus polymyxa]AOK91784.1 hypothetical protein AOU00_19395 [Paenibacillus polymyxa]
METNFEHEISKRGITRLCHFTKASKLLHILRNESGIIANSFLDDQLDLLEKNDENRYDGREDFVCCSVEYPNTWYLRRIKDNDPVFKEWVVLLINPQLLLDETTLFCHRNAAANRGAHIKGGFAGFNGMFKNPVFGKTTIYRSEKMLTCCPTDGQAEVLIHKNISRSDIIGIATPTKEHARKMISRVSLLSDARQDINWIVSPELFDVNWNNIIRLGRRPMETPYIKE